MWFAVFRRLFFRRARPCVACGLYPARRDGFCSDGCARTFEFYN